MRFGVHCRLWTTSWTREDLGLLDRASALGFQALEINLGTLEQIDPPAILGRATQVGLEVIGTIALGQGQGLATSDGAMRAGTIAHLKSAVNAVRDMGGHMLGGMLYAVPGQFSGRGPTEGELSWLAEGLQEVAAYARGCEVSLAIEPVNRYETYLINTAAQAQAVIDRIGEPNLGLLLDTYHMNIEERGIPATLLRHATALRHLHVNESDRGSLGGGNIDWPPIFDALAQMRYEGMASIEVFAAPSPHAPAITPIWRPLFPSPDQMARDGLAFLEKRAQDANAS